MTMQALFNNCFLVGQEVLYRNSEYDSSIFVSSFNFFISVNLAREERLELPTPGFGDQCSTD